MPGFRIGFGSDIHRLENDIDFFLGGIKINHDKGAVGHSDADALIHALCDALLGAANKRDIGYHFPDNSDKFKGIDSKILLQEVAELIKKEGYNIVNIDSTINLQKPKLKDYIPLMKETLSGILNIPVNDISIKAKTAEGLGFVGTEEGVSAEVVVLIQSV